MKTARDQLAIIALACALPLLLPGSACAQALRFALSGTDGLRLHNVAAEPVTFKGKRGIRLTESPELLRRPDFVAGTLDAETLAWIGGIQFSNGVIEVDVAGTPAPGANAGARGFVGIAFRSQVDDRAEGLKPYDAIYLRPTNGRADDQERRNHAVQYIAHPDWPWFRLRRETPSRYESYVDLVPDEWIHLRIEVRGARARLYVGDAPQPVLLVNDLKSGPTGTGAIALWIGPGTIAHFRDLVVTPDPVPSTSR